MSKNPKSESLPRHSSGSPLRSENPKSPPLTPPVPRLVGGWGELEGVKIKNKTAATKPRRFLLSKVANYCKINSVEKYDASRIYRHKFAAGGER